MDAKKLGKAFKKMQVMFLYFAVIYFVGRVLTSLIFNL